MRYLLSVLLLAPLLARTQQPVSPVISADYLALIKTDTLAAKPNPTIAPITQFQIRQPYTSSGNILKIRSRNGELLIQPAATKWLTFGGNYTVSTGTSSVNKPTLVPPFDNDIFRTGYSTSHSISLQANLKRNNWTPLWQFALKAGTTNETAVIPDNTNTARNLGFTAERDIKKFSITTGYTWFSSHFSNDNSTGFLNRAYQNALFTSFSPHDGNPWTTLANNGHFAARTQQTGQLSLHKNQGHLTFGISNTLDAVNDTSNLSLPPGTPSFPTGLIYTRRDNDRHLSSDGYLSWKLDAFNSNFTSTTRLNYIFNDEKTGISYPANNYAYHRSGADAAATINTDYSGRDFDAGLHLGAKTFSSTTSPHPSFFLPEISGYLSSWKMFDYFVNAKLAASFTTFYSEPAIDHSYAPFMLTRLAPQDASRFAPTTEVQTFNGLSPMEHREFTSSLELRSSYFLSLRAGYTVRDTKDNVFPTYDNNTLTLKNLADTRYRDFELQFKINSKYNYRNHLSFTNSLSFNKYTDIVTRIEDGYDGYPIAGFSTVYKALLKGSPVGMIMADNANNRPTVIGNPTPGYTLKFTHLAQWGPLSFNLDWEYRKGGDVWNGTAAFLRDDYAGPASAYIQKADNIRINTLALAYDVKVNSYLQKIRLTIYAQNLLLWSAYRGADPSQLLYDQTGSNGLDFFNLPSTKTFGAGASFQF